MQISKNTVWLSSLLPYLHTLEPFNLACYQQCFNKMLDFRNCNLILFCLIRHKLQRDTMPFDKNVFLFIFIAVGGGCKYLETEIAFLRETLMIQMSGEKTEIVAIWDIHFNVFIWIGIAVIIIGLKHRKDCVTLWRMAEYIVIEYRKLEINRCDRVVVYACGVVVLLPSDMFTTLSHYINSFVWHRTIPLTL